MQALVLFLSSASNVRLIQVAVYGVILFIMLIVWLVRKIGEDKPYDNTSLTSPDPPSQTTEEPRPVIDHSQDKAIEEVRQMSQEIVMADTFRADMAQNNQMVKTRPSPANGWFIALMILFALLSLILGGFYFKEKKEHKTYSLLYEQMLSKNREYSHDIESLKEDLEQSKRDLADLKADIGNAVPFVIRDIQMATYGGSEPNDIDYGNILYSSQTRYLRPKISYTCFKSGSRTVYVKFFRPDGSLSSGGSSPSGYSYSNSVSFDEGDHEKDLKGWGGTDWGHWSSGNYVIEIWYDNACIKRKEFRIY